MVAQGDFTVRPWVNGPRITLVVGLWKGLRQSARGVCKAQPSTTDQRRQSSAKPVTERVGSQTSSVALRHALRAS